MDDSVSFERIIKKGGHDPILLISPKPLFILFLLFMLVVSDFFTNNVIAIFQGSLSGRNLSTYGFVLQGIFLVLFFILSIYFIQSDVL